MVLEPAAAERILDAAATEQWLSNWLQRLPTPPADLADLPDVGSRARRLLDTACELEIEPGVSLQWFAVRLEPPGRP